MTSELPPTLGLVLAGGLARRMGGGDKPLKTIGGVTILDRVLSRLRAAMRVGHHQRQRRSGALRRDRPAGRRRRRAGFRRTARRHSRGARLGGGACPRCRICRQCAGRLPVPAARSGGAAPSGAAAGQPAAGLRALRRMAASGGGAVAGRAARRPARGGDDEGLRKIEVWTARHGVALADWPVSPVDPFFNVNTPDDAAEADRIAAQHPDA